MPAPMKLAGTLFFAIVTSSTVAEIYKAYPNDSAFFSLPYNGSSIVVTSNGFIPYAITATRSGPVVYDTNLNASDNGSLYILNPVEYQVNGSSETAPYPNSILTFNDVRFRIDASGPVVVTNNVATLTATFYSGQYSVNTFYSSIDSRRTLQSIDFGVTPVSFNVKAFVADNVDWADSLLIPPDDGAFGSSVYNAPYYRTTPYNGLPGLTGEDNDDTAGAGIYFYNLTGTMNVLVENFDFPGVPYSSHAGTITNPFSIYSFNVVPEASSMALASAGVLGGVASIWRSKRRSS